MVSEEKFFKEKIYGLMHDWHNAMTIARWPLASGAKNQALCDNIEPVIFILK